MLASRAASSAGVPAALRAEVEELVEHRDDRLPARRSGRPRPARSRRRRCRRGTPRRRGEEEALVVAQREVGERVPAVGVHQPFRVRPSRPRCAGAVRRSGRKYQHREHDEARDAEGQQRGGEERREERRRVRVGPVQADEPAEDRGEPRQKVTSGVMRSPSVHSAGEAEHGHADHVDRDEPQHPEQRGRVGGCAEVVPVEQQGARTAPGTSRRPTGCGPLSMCGRRRAAKSPTAPATRAACARELVGEQEQQQPDHHRHHVPGHRHPTGAMPSGSPVMRLLEQRDQP